MMGTECAFSGKVETAVFGESRNNGLRGKFKEIIKNPNPQLQLTPYGAPELIVRKKTEQRMSAI
jgi:hypothetical protein